MSNGLLKGPEKRILGGLLLVAAGVLVHMFVVKPMNEKRARYDTEASEINRASESALAKIRSIQMMRAEYAALSNEVAALTNQYVVRKVLGSYPMEQTIYSIAAETGFHVMSCVELGKVRTPDAPPTAAAAAVRKKPGPGAKGAKTAPPLHRFDRFQMEVRGDGGFWSVAELIRRLEEANPFFGVVSLEIASVTSKPERHNVVIRCEWPVDADPPPAPAKGKK